MSAPERICVAKIATAHGVRGLVKLHVFVDDISLLEKPLFTSDDKDDTLSLSLKNKTAKHWIAEIEKISDRNEAEALRGTELYILKSDLPELEDGEFYISDLIGLLVEEDGKHIGKVIAVENFGAGDLLEIKPEATESFYLPYNDETVIDIQSEKINVSIPEGVRE